MGNGSYWDGSEWSTVQVDSPFDKAKVFVLSTAPVEPTPLRTGDLFIDTDTAKLSFRNGASWTPLSELATIADITGLQSELDNVHGVQITGDLNAQTTPGNYIFLMAQVTLANNHPISSGQAGTLTVTRAGIYITQRVTYMNGAVTSVVQEFVRFSANSGTSWGGWLPVAAGGTSATTFALGNHVHTAADTTSGTFAAARLPAATETTIGAVELATNAEVVTGTDTTRAVTPDGLSARLEAYPAEVVPVGTIQIFAGTSVPSGWLICDGSSFVAATYPRLYSAIGVTYGGTSTNPLLPNLKGRVVVGRDSSQTEFDTLGETGGEKTHLLTTAEMPTHTHTQDAHTHSDPGHSHSASSAGETQEHTHGPGNLTGGLRMRNSDDSGTTLWGTLACNFSAYDIYGNGSTGRSGTPAVEITGGATGGRSAQHNHAITVNGAYTGLGAATATNQNTGGGGSHNNLQPYISLNYIIRAV